VSVGVKATLSYKPRLISVNFPAQISDHLFNSINIITLSIIRLRILYNCPKRVEC